MTTPRPARVEAVTARRRRPGRSRLTERRLWTDLVLVSALALAGTVLFFPLFDSPVGVVVAAIGVSLGIATGLVSARMGLSALPTLAATGALHVLVAPWVLPDVGGGLEAVRTVLAATITVWRDALTLPLPLTAFPAMTVLPWLAGLATGVVATRAADAGRVHLAGLTVLAQPAVAIAWGGRTTVAPTALGVTLTIGVLALWALAAQRGRRDRVAEVLEDADAGVRTDVRRSVLRSAALLAATGLVVALAVPAAPHARTVLRDLFEPPLDLTEYATPLSLVRTLETDLASTPLLRLTGLPEGARIRLAALDSYDGLSARVGQSSEGAARFQRVGRDTPLAPGVDASGATSVEIAVEGYTFPWVPTVSDALSVAAQGPRSTAISESLYYDTFSSTGIATAGLTDGDRLTEQVAVPPVLSDTQLAGLEIAEVSLGPVQDVPAGVESLATTLADAESTPLGQIRALQQALRTGYYSDGTKSPSEPGHGAARLASMVEADTLVGDDEQYAVLMMLMCRSLGIPARVVMGFEPATDSRAEDVTGEDVSAWVEVAFENAGWVAFDVTPERDQVPQQQTTQKVSNPEPQVLQPPLPLQDPVELPPTYEDEPQEDPEDDTGVVPMVLLIALRTIAAIAAPVVLILALKALRRRRRRGRQGVDSALGAWEEVVDRATDLGSSAPAGATRRETAAALGPNFPTADLPRFGRAVDAQVFGSGEPASYAVDRIWESVDAIIPAMAADRSLVRRAAARLSMRSLIRSAGRRTRRKPSSRPTPRRTHP
ncbi:MAG: transglutaminase domain-containing protein [Actinomyces sp.]|uniref:transglutaminase domain-containing protein n=1 Tax=Actinomyces sp. TaxID=29317 RepID=UPI0026DCBC8F|nr:transglutaminase domain-containing protein [Actinomyces sp.]MDO4243486.1 transglutaminase domain-containing protein [Actinomyces sp.]